MQSFGKHKTNAGGWAWYHPHPDNSWHDHSLTVNARRPCGWNIMSWPEFNPKMSRSKSVLKGKRVSINMFLFLLLRKNYLETSKFCNPWCNNYYKQNIQPIQVRCWGTISPHRLLRGNGSFTMKTSGRFLTLKPSRQTICHQIMMPLVVTHWEELSTTQWITKK